MRFNTLKKQGKILHIGVSNFTKEQMEEAVKILCYRSISATVFYGRSEMGAADPVGLCSENGSYDLWNTRRRHFNRKYRELKEYGVDDNRNRFYPYFKEPLFSKVMLLLRTIGSDQ